MEIEEVFIVWVSIHTVPHTACLLISPLSEKLLKLHVHILKLLLMQTALGLLLIQAMTRSRRLHAIESELSLTLKVVKVLRVRETLEVQFSV